MQLGASYHGIYNVEWLGWDLVEPLTYTSSTGVAVFFMWYMLRNRGLEDVRNLDILKHRTKTIEEKKIREQGNFSFIDKTHKEMLMQQIQMVDDEIRELEKQRIF